VGAGLFFCSSAALAGCQGTGCVGTVLRFWRLDTEGGVEVHGSVSQALALCVHMAFDGAMLKPMGASELQVISQGFDSVGLEGPPQAADAAAAGQEDSQELDLALLSLRPVMLPQASDLLGRLEKASTSSSLEASESIKLPYSSGACQFLPFLWLSPLDFLLRRRGLSEWHTSCEAAG